MVPAAGVGARMAADRPKQFLTLRGRPLLYWSIRALLAREDLHGCVVALPASDTEPSLDLPDSRLAFCAGGATRGASVLAGLDALAAAPEDWVLVHDGARPCLDSESLDALIQHVRQSGIGGLLAEPVTDTLKQADASQRVVATVPRDGLWRAQTPQMFRYGDLREALRAAIADGATITDEASAMERQGHPVQLVAGSAVNLKVTHGPDLALAGYYLDDRELDAQELDAQGLNVQEHPVLEPSGENP